MEWNPKKIPENVDLLIFDNIPMLELLPRQRWKPFFGLQDEFEIIGKYIASILVIRSWQSFIYLYNMDPREGIIPAIRNYIDINCNVITLDKKLFI
jgi:hypothetical protein